MLFIIDFIYIYIYMLILIICMYCNSKDIYICSLVLIIYVVIIYY